MGPSHPDDGGEGSQNGWGQPFILTLPFPRRSGSSPGILRRGLRAHSLHSFPSRVGEHGARTRRDQDTFPGPGTAVGSSGSRSPARPARAHSTRALPSTHTQSCGRLHRGAPVGGCGPAHRALAGPARTAARLPSGRARPPPTPGSVLRLGLPRLASVPSALDCARTPWGSSRLVRSRLPACPLAPGRAAPPPPPPPAPHGQLLPAPPPHSHAELSSGPGPGRRSPPRLPPSRTRPALGLGALAAPGRPSPPRRARAAATAAAAAVAATRPPGPLPRRRPSEAVMRALAAWAEPRAETQAQDGRFPLRLRGPSSRAAFPSPLP